MFSSFFDGKNYVKFRQYHPMYDYRGLNKNLDFLEEIINKEDILEIYPKGLHTEYSDRINLEFTLYIFTKAMILELRPLKGDECEITTYNIRDSKISLLRKGYDRKLVITFEDSSSLEFSSETDTNDNWKDDFRKLIIAITNNILKEMGK
jgi:hypothetical protein